MMFHERTADVDTSLDVVLAAIADRVGPTVAISNEVGMGIVPGDPMSRHQVWWG